MIIRCIVFVLFLVPVCLKAKPVASSNIQEDDARGEPVFCQSLQPSISNQQSLDEWMTGPGFSLKYHGCWKSHIDWGHKGIEAARRKKNVHNERALLISLASSYFYLGDEEQCLTMAKQAQSLSNPDRDWAVIVESLYLLSAVARVRNQKEAVKLNEQALTILEKQSVPSPFLRGKVLYNLAAALTDTDYTDSQRASTALQEAETLFRQTGSQFDVVRTVIRLARVDSLDGNNHQALKRLNQVQFQLDTFRTRMLFYYQRAKVFLALKHLEEAFRDVERAEELSISLDARKDNQRIQSLKESVLSEKGHGEYPLNSVHARP